MSVEKIRASLLIWNYFEKEGNIGLTGKSISGMSAQDLHKKGLDQFLNSHSVAAEEVYSEDDEDDDFELEH